MDSKELEKLKVKDFSGKLAKIFLYNPLTALLAIFLLVIGYIALEVMPREEDPQIQISGGSIIVPAPGLTPMEIKKIIVEPLEQKLREIHGVEHIFSIAKEDMAIVNVMYYIGQSKEISNLKLYDKVMQNMDELPTNIHEPLIKPFDIDIDIPIMTVAFYQKGDNGSGYEKYYEFVNTIHELKYEINGLDNVSKTQLQGDKKEQYNINVDILKLKAYHLSMNQIVKAISAITINVPNINTKTKEGKLAVFGVENVIQSIKDVENIIVAKYNNSPIYLNDIATVEDGINYQDKRSAKIFAKQDNGEFFQSDQITLNISKLARTNAVTLTNEIKELLAEKKEYLHNNDIGFIITRDYGERANEAVGDLVNNLVITIFIISIVLMFFLGWKESLIVTFTVPAILAVTLFIAYLGDQSINRITLFAFLLSLGLLVDAAIIVIENIHRHLHSKNSENEDIDTILIKATDEIGAPTNVATLAIILTMVPMAFVGGMMGEFMKPIPYNVPVALIASLGIAYIFTPYLSKKLLKKKDHNV